MGRLSRARSSRTEGGSWSAAAPTRRSRANGSPGAWWCWSSPASAMPSAGMGRRSTPRRWRCASARRRAALCWSRERRSPRGGRGRRVIDVDQGWRTERLDLEPLAVGHAAELAPLLDDTRLHEFTGGAPLSTAALAARYARLAERRSPGGDQVWGNWVMRLRGTGAAVGTVQATLPAAGPAAGPAEVAWVVAHAAQGCGYAKEAARSLVTMLQAAGWTVVAHIHPGHLASQGVACAAGLSPTGDVYDGEVRWISTGVS